MVIFLCFILASLLFLAGFYFGRATYREFLLSPQGWDDLLSIMKIKRGE